VENMNRILKRVLGSVLAECCLIGEDPNWTEVLGTVAATINSQRGRGKHDVSAFEAVYGQKYHHPLLCSKEEARKCWTLPDHLGVTNDEAVATCIAQHFYVRDKEYTSNSNAVTDNESGYFSEEELSKSEEQEVSDDYFYAHLFDYETDNKDESNFAFGTPEKAVAQSSLKMPNSLPLLDKPDEDHSGHHPENDNKRRDVDVSFDAESSHFNDLDKKLAAVHSYSR
jgi:hypothetical protein